jgi:O-antigen ligase
MMPGRAGGAIPAAWRGPLRFAGGVALAAIVWLLTSKAVVQALLVGAFVYALVHRRRGSAAWATGAGRAFMALLAFTFLSVAWSSDASSSLSSLGRQIPFLAAVFAIPVIFDTERRLRGAMLASAVALTLILGVDLVRLNWLLGSFFIREARYTAPFVLNHPNVASMMAGSAAIVLFRFAWIWRREPSRLVPCVLALGVNLFYLYALTSRGPQLAFVGALCAYVLLLVGWKRKILAVALFALLAAGAATQVKHINRRFLNPDVKSLTERSIVWGHTWKLAGEAPLLGHGHGKKVFTKVYYASSPPKATYLFPHPHEYWLMVLFEHGLPGLAFHLTAWILLGLRLIRTIGRGSTFADRLAAGTPLVLLLHIHLYGLGDYPDSLVRILLWWLIPASLVATREEKPATA